MNKWTARQVLSKQLVDLENELYKLQTEYNELSCCMDEEMREYDPAKVLAGLEREIESLEGDIESTKQELYDVTPPEER